MTRRTDRTEMVGWTLAALLVLTLAGCGGGSGGGGGPVAPPVTPQPNPGAPAFTIDGTDPLPGVVFALVGTSGGTGAGGTFQPGDFVTVQFTLKSGDGTTLDLSLMDSGSAYLSGPTFNYNRVIPRQNDLRSSIYLGNATWQYTFPVAIPPVFAAPYNDTAAFGTFHGELTGQPLVAGTYSIGLETSKVYTVDGDDHRDPGSLVVDILLLGATSLDTREVVKDEHCNQCHTTLRAHGDRRAGVRLCLLCHTSGAEDKNDSAIEGGTPGVSIDFKVMAHKLHMGHHLPSVLGMTTDANGDRVYAPITKRLNNHPTAGTYKLVGNSVLDAGEFNFPVWPSLNIGMPKDFGWTALNPAPTTQVGLDKQAVENEFAQGAVACSKCHGDPDGAGPITAPAHGHLHEDQPSAAACGSCHDDIDWAKPYKANQDVMIAIQGNPGAPACITCHPATTTGPGLFPTRQAHTHPLLDPAVNAGLHFNVTSVGESGTNNGDGTVDPGERLQAVFSITNDAGTAVTPASLASISAVIAGPTTNYNLVLSGSLSTSHPAFSSGVGSPPVYTLNVPEAVVLERVGVNTAAVGESFGTSRSPHVLASLTTVFTRTATGAVSASPTALAALQNYIDLTPGTGTSFIADASPGVAPAAGNAAYASAYIVIDDGNLAAPVGAPLFPPPPAVKEEYSRIIWRQGDRLWLAVPTRVSHDPGVSVKRVTLATKTQVNDYALTTTSGTITEDASDFGPGGETVLCSYTTEFIMPSMFPPPLNDSPDLGETWGEWKGKPIVDGTYTVDLYGYRNLVVNRQGETQTYRGTSVAGDVDFVVGQGTLTPYNVISAADNCYKCHNELFFHGGGRRSFGTCIMCHGDAGAEDRPQWASSNGPATPGTTISFRTMLHKIHMGEHLADKDTYTVVGFGGNAYQYGTVGFPALPAGVKECTKCHGNDAWKAPTNRNHPTAQLLPVRVWRAVCGACHSSTAATAHIDSNTSPGGLEACEVCHGPGRAEDVELKHVPR